MTLYSPYVSWYQCHVVSCESHHVFQFVEWKYFVKTFVFCYLIQAHRAEGENGGQDAESARQSATAPLSPRAYGEVMDAVAAVAISPHLVQETTPSSHCSCPAVVHSPSFSDTRVSNKNASPPPYSHHPSHLYGSKKKKPCLNSSCSIIQPNHHSLKSSQKRGKMAAHLTSTPHMSRDDGSLYDVEQDPADASYSSHPVKSSQPLPEKKNCRNHVQMDGKSDISSHHDLCHAQNDQSAIKKPGGKRRMSTPPKRGDPLWASPPGCALDPLWGIHFPKHGSFVQDPRFVAYHDKMGVHDSSPGFFPAPPHPGKQTFHSNYGKNQQEQCDPSSSSSSLDQVQSKRVSWDLPPGLIQQVTGLVNRLGPWGQDGSCSAQEEVCRLLSRLEKKRKGENTCEDVSYDDSYEEDQNHDDDQENYLTGDEEMLGAVGGAVKPTPQMLARLKDCDGHLPARCDMSLRPLTRHSSKHYQ